MRHCNIAVLRKDALVLRCNTTLRYCSIGALVGHGGIAVLGVIQHCSVAVHDLVAVQ